MLRNRYTAILFYIAFLNVNFCLRRLKDGSYPRDDKRYMAYFVKSNLSRPSYDSWLCGGAIISSTKILTAAACLVELSNIYAIAGYRYYVNGLDIDTDECTRRWKQRVVKTCVHRDYTLNHSSPAGWLRLDIGVATVEKPYNFNDLTYRLHCSYVPAPIAISYQLTEIAPGNNVLMLGWGYHGLRQPHDLIDRNSHYLQAAVSKIHSKTVCHDKFRNVKGLTELINNVAICVTSHGSIDVNGDVVTRGPPANTRCSFRRNINGTLSVKCKEEHKWYSDYELDSDNDYRKYSKMENKKTNQNNSDKARRLNVQSNNMNTNHIAIVKGTRRQVICQNDHGSPLVTWVGASEVVIGVALTSEYSNPDLCVGPSIFYSIYAAKDWLQCLLADDEITVKLCAKHAQLKGYDFHGKQVNWGDSINSPIEVKETAKDENFKTVDVELRPQVPIHSLPS